MRLVIVESPAKSKTISKYLGKDYTVKASVGHVRDLPKSNRDAVDIEHGFKPKYVVIRGKEDVIAEIKKFAGKADEILLATDPDREGEAIAWHVVEACGLGGSPKRKISGGKFSATVARIVFHEITKSAIEEALAHPRAIDENLRKAQEARRVLDRLFGYDLSELIWKKVRYGLSAGRVQSPALRILMERERQIKAFKPEDYWVITALVETAHGDNLLLTCSEEPRDKDYVERILKTGREGEWQVVDIAETEVKRSPRPPFITSTLQQSASSRLGFAPARTMRVAQQLYEAGFITYMRTDSTTLAAVAQRQIAGAVKEKFGEKYVSLRQYATKSKLAQEAHEAIRPTDASREKVGVTPEQQRLYRLIWQRAVSSQMSAALLAKTKIVARVKNVDIPDFVANGSRVLFDGWLRADTAARGEDVELPKVSTGEQLKLLELKDEQKQTQPPPRYSEAGLIKELEKRGIGRPSTYASIIKTLYDRQYVERIDKKTLKPTEVGEVVSTFLESNFENYISDTFTAEMEDKLDNIAEGKRDYEKTLSDFYTPFRREVDGKKDIPRLTELGDAPKELKCPECGGKMVYKLGRSGRFMSCVRFPECYGARTADGDPMEGPKETGEKCPECGGALVERSGRFGQFIACANYPKCKYKPPNSSLKPQTSTGVKCTKCGEGEIVEKRGRFGLFYSCSNYPKCKYAINKKPTGRVCDQCGFLMMEGTKTLPERCSNKGCENYKSRFKNIFPSS